MIVPTLEQIESNIYDLGGFCVACGEEAYNVEPDAENYICESCGETEVFGSEQLVLLGLVK